jgi:nondiscriminating glutamyl-tRNA synthetase
MSARAGNSAVNSKDILLRFAPSPTGEMHLGNLRTAFINWLIAKKLGGSLLVRVDDTDTKRNVEGAEEKIFRDLNWLGIDHQAVDHQSKRHKIYEDVVAGLTASKAVYPCFCSPAELEIERELLLKIGKPPRYNGKCAALTPAQVKEKKDAGISFCYRLRIPSNHGSVTWDDLVRGPQSMDANHFGDFVLTREDGSATYNLASIIDDVDLGVTHVVRGEDHVSNTPRQILIAEAVARIPGIKESLKRKVSEITFGHIPLLLAADKTKLSKRNGAKTVDEYQQEGVLPVALQNAMALVSWNPPEGKEILSTDELIAAFDVANMSKSPSVFAESKLLWINGEHLKRVPQEERAKLAKPYVDKVSGDVKINAKIIDTVWPELSLLSEIPQKLQPLLAPQPPAATDDEKKVAKAWLENFTADFSEWQKKVQTSTGVKGKGLYFPLRRALTGQEHGFEMRDLVEILGEKIIKERLQSYVTS